MLRARPVRSIQCRYFTLSTAVPVPVLMFMMFVRVRSTELVSLVCVALRCLALPCVALRLRLHCVFRSDQVL